MVELEHMQQPVWASGPPWVKEATHEVLHPLSSEATEGQLVS